MRMGLVDPFGSLPGRPAASPLHERADFGPNPGALTMFDYCPTGLKPGAGLVVVLHGCGQTAKDYDHGTGWSALADRFGFALLAPEQSKSNNLNGCFNWFAPDDTERGSGEAASICQMIDTMIRKHALDPRRIFITGLSAGGAMTSVMLATYPEIFAGGAIIAGLPYGAASNMFEALSSMRKVPDKNAAAWGDKIKHASSHKGPWPRLSVWHGDADNIVAPANLEAIVTQWCDVQGIATPPQTQTEALYRRRVWQDADGRAQIEAYTIPGLGHGVPIQSGQAPDASGAAGPFILDIGVPSSLRIAEFFGLTGAVEKAVPQHAPRMQAAQTPTADSAFPTTGPLRPVKARIHHVITQALKAAGLIKHD